MGYIFQVLIHDFVVHIGFLIIKKEDHKDNIVKVKEKVSVKNKVKVCKKIMYHIKVFSSVVLIKVSVHIGKDELGCIVVLILLILDIEDKEI